MPVFNGSIPKNPVSGISPIENLGKNRQRSYTAIRFKTVIFA
ncbi:hypothetical protein PCH70_47600 [Pseudomonas cichorii JBC1]|nr:hypothetical protein PCH70_47600 [Pseudomonas cichorii JBC1]